MARIKRTIAAAVGAVGLALTVGAAPAAANPWPPGSECWQNGCIYDWAVYEMGRADRNREVGPNNCNYYSGYWGNSGTNNCGVINGTLWRSNEWCADFARYTWHKAGANVAGLDAWAGSFYRASPGSYHPKAGYTPRIGDAVLYDWDGTSPSLGINGWDVDHVESWSGGSLTAIEGNTSGGAARHGVFRKSRSTSRVVGYVSPRF